MEDLTPKKKKKPLNQCRHCGVELSWKENFHGTLCAVCERIQFDKDNQYGTLHGGSLRPSR